MPRLIASLLLVASFYATASAQEHPDFEVFTGYSRATSSGTALHGWNVSVAINQSRWLGWVADFSSHYGDERLTGPFPGFEIDATTKLHGRLFGPRFSLRTHPVLTPFAHLLLGESDQKLNASTFGFSFTNSQMSFTIAAGGGLDIRVKRNIVLRAQLEHWFVVGSRPNATRLTTGIVLQW
jgi:hypothetical protein